MTSVFAADERVNKILNVAIESPCKFKSFAIPT